MDNKSLNLTDVDIELVSTVSGVAKQYLNPERQIVRYQFMEVLVRLANTKFYRKGTALNFCESLEKLFTLYLQRHLEMNSHFWREHKLWTPENDHLYLRYLPYLKKVFMKYSGRDSTPGNPKPMSLEEFSWLLNDMHLIDDRFG